MKHRFLLFMIFSAFLFSCENEKKRETTVPSAEEEQEVLQERREMVAIEDTIEVYNPRAGDTVYSPLLIVGRARGYWFFEASFAVRLLDANGNEIAVAPAGAQESWMTQDWVPFKATLEFDETAFEEGVLILEKANPSGLEEHARELRIKMSTVPSP